MIPSDHFVKFYNEIFKYLERRGGDALDRYYARVADRQAYFTLEAFKRDGLKGMYDYWERIRIEENCDMVNRLEDGCYSFEFFSCPSLSKAVDNDAGPCPKYCNHCPGWILPLMTKAGVFAVYNLIDRKQPRCEMFVFTEKERAAKQAALLIEKYGKDVILTNF